MQPDPKNYSLVEGDFRTFRIRRILPSDYEEIAKHIRAFFLNDEITYKLVQDGQGNNPEEVAQEFMNFCKAAMDLKMCFLAEDKETGELASIRLNYRNIKGVNHFKDVEAKTRYINVVFSFLGKLNEDNDIFEKYGITENGEFFLASTTPKFRNQGLVTELYRRCLVYFKAEGLTLAKVFVSSFYTRAATKTLGFETLATLQYKDAKDKDGNLLFDPVKAGDNFMAMDVKIL